MAITCGKEIYSYEGVKPRKLLYEALQLVEMQNDFESIGLVSDVLPNVPMKLKFDGARCRYILHTLIMSMLLRLDEDGVLIISTSLESRLKNKQTEPPEDLLSFSNPKQEVKPEETT